MGIEKWIPGVGLVVDEIHRSQDYKRFKENRDWEKQWQIDQMNIQRQWSLEDWSRQNEYDSFKNQRKLYEDAGFNPNFMLGGRATAASNDIRPATSSGGSRTPPTGGGADITRAAAAMSSLAVNEGQIENMQAQKDLLFEQRRKTAVETLKVMEDTKMTATQRAQLEATFADVLQGIRLENRVKETEVGKNIADTTRTNVLTEIEQDRNNREKLKNTADVQKTMAEIINLQLDAKRKQFEIEQQPQAKERIKQELLHLEALQIIAYNEAEMKKIEAEMFRKYGVSKGDPAYMRLFITEMQSSKGSTDSYKKDPYNAPVNKR